MEQKKAVMQLWPKNPVARILLVATLPVAAWLRLADLGAQGLRTDEIFVISRAGGSLSAALGQVTLAPGGVPLEFLARNVVLRFSNSEFYLRLPDAIFGIVTIYVVYLLAARLFDSVTGSVAAFLLGISSFHVFHSQDARYYALFLLASTWSTLCLVRARDGGRWVRWVAYVTTMTVGFYTAYFTAFVALVHTLYVLGPATLPRRWRRREPDLLGFILSGIAIAFAFAPWALLTERRTLIPWPPPDLITSISTVGEEFSNGPGPAVAFYWLLFALGAVFAVRHKPAALGLSLLFIVIPLPLIVLVDTHIRYFFGARQMIFALPFFLSLVAYGLVRGSASLARLFRLGIQRPVESVVLLAGVAVFAVFAGSGIPQYHGYSREDWRGAAGYLADRMRPQDVLAMTFTEFGPPDGDNILFYLGKLGVKPEGYRLVSVGSPYEARVDSLLAGNRVWFVTGFPDFFRRLQPEVLAAIEAASSKVAKFPGMGSPIVIYRSQTYESGGILTFPQPTSYGPAGPTAGQWPVSPQRVMMGDFENGEALQAFPAASTPYVLYVAHETEERVLDFAIGVEGSLAEAPVRFRASLGADSDPLFEETISAPEGSADSRWLHHSIRVPRGVSMLSLTASVPEGANGTSALHAWWGSPSVRVAGGAAPAPVIVIMIDTLRADHLSMYGYERPTSPVLESFARDAVLFTSCFSQAPWTVPSVASILTSAYSSAHQAGRHDLLHAHAPGMDLKFVDKFDPLVLTLPEVLRDAGYRTVLVSNNVFLSPLFNFDGFFVRSSWMVYPESKGEDLARESIEQLRQYAHDPLFMFVVFMDPHVPPSAPPPFSGQFSRKGDLSASDLAIDGYDADVAYVDSQVGAFLAELKKLGTYTRALIVIMADHGEELYERGTLGHDHSRFDEVIHTPLLIKFPDRQYAGAVVDRLVRNLDVGATILDYLELDLPQGARGSSVMPLIRPESGGSPPDRLALTESEGLLSAEEKISVHSRRHKLIYNVHTGRELLFDLSEDPREERDLSTSAFSLVEDLRVPVHALFMEKFAGLHLACRSGTPAVVSGSVEAEKPVLERVHLYFHEDGDTAQLSSPGTAKFSLDLTDGFDAVLIQGLSAGDGARFALDVDGAPISPAQISLGSPPTPAVENPWSTPDIERYSVVDFGAAAELARSKERPSAPRCFVWTTRVEGTRLGAGATSEGEQGEIDQELRERLRTLGYIE